MIKVTYLRNRPGRHSRQVIAIRSRAHLQRSDTVMAKIGFVREGQQARLTVEPPCARCRLPVDGYGIHLTGESWHRRCVRLAFGGEKE